MRIGIDASKLMPPRDGLGTYTLGLVRALAEADGDHELRLYGALHPIDPEVLARLLPGLPDRCRLAQGRWPTTGEVDLFHATTLTFHPGFEGPLLFTCHDLTFLSHPECHLLENRIHCIEGVLQALLAGASFLAVSESTRAELGRWLEIPKERVRVIYEAADERFAPMPDAEAAARVRERYGVEGSFLLSVGTLEPRKNLRRLLEAYVGLDEAERRRLPLLIAGGQGWDGGELARLVQTEPKLATVRLLGHVPDDDLPALYRAARAFLYPSLAEGFGLPPLEAMACGAPVLVSSTTSLPEVVGDAGVLIDPFDVDAWRSALGELAANPEVSPATREAALTQAARFSWRRAALETLDLYASLL